MITIFKVSNCINDIKGKDSSSIGIQTREAQSFEKLDPLGASNFRYFLRPTNSAHNEIPFMQLFIKPEFVPTKQLIEKISSRNTAAGS